MGSMGDSVGGSTTTRLSAGWMDSASVTGTGHAWRRCLNMKRGLASVASTDDGVSILPSPMFVTDVRGRVTYLDMAVLIVGDAEPADPFAELIADLSQSLALSAWPE